MKLSESNLKVFKAEKGHCLKIIMPDGSDNYLHLQLYNDIESMCLIRDLLMDTEFYQDSIHIIEDEGYYRLILLIKDVNGDSYEFHSRKLNLNDVVFERMQLIISD